jgi:hypothetical protein
MQKMTFPTPKSVSAHIRRHAVTHFAIFDSPAELADFAASKHDQKFERGAHNSFYGNESHEDSLQRARTGDSARVAPSAALLERFERFVFETGKSRWIDDVAGALPNVQAYLAGQPLQMRRKTRDESASAPIAIIVDLTTSASISADAIARRGAAILALVRILSTRRPVELWAGSMLDANHMQDAIGVFAHIETAPLDLATAAYVMTSAGFPRRLCYGISRAHYGYQGHWPYGSHSASRELMRDICKPAFDHVSEVLCIPACHSEDDITGNPEGWIERKLEELTPVSFR